jgi:hypothetical protein
MKRLNLIKTIGVVGTLGVSSAALGIGLTSCSIKTISYDFGTLHHDETMDVIISGDELTYNGEYTTILTTKDGKTPAGLPDGVDYYYDVSQKVGIYSQDTGKRTIIGIIFKSLPPTSNKQTVTA